MTDRVICKITADANKDALVVVAKVNELLAESGLKVNKIDVISAALCEFRKECAQRSGEDFAEWIAATFKGEF